MKNCGNSSTESACRLCRLAKLKDASPNGTYRELSEQTAKLYALLNLPGRRGNVGRDGCRRPCDLQSSATKSTKNKPADWKQLKRVIVAGETVWEDGKRTNFTPGIFLRRS